ncbi:MAG TPA: DUF1653 domain-containing protein [Lachnospiraceae bacterium]|nr:DUF1653 domain-containing protein [Lachnospiraceae bacterium]
MNNSPRPYEVYRHFKGNIYQVLTLAEDCEDGSMQVVYQALYSPFKVYVRSLEVFTSKVDKEKYPNVEQEYRFQIQNEDCLNSFITTKTPSKEFEVPKKVLDNNIDDLDNDTIDPLLMEFLDSDTYEEKINILVALHSRINQDMINTIAMALDIEINDGDIETRFEAIKNCLVTFQKYEINRRN